MAVEDGEDRPEKNDQGLGEDPQAKPDDDDGSQCDPWGGVNGRDPGVEIVVHLFNAGHQDAQRDPHRYGQQIAV